MSEIRLLQYNVGNRPDRLRELLARPGTEQFDVIAVQEPPYNKHTGGTYCPRSCSFWPVYRVGEKHKPRVAMMINKGIPSGNWMEQWFGDDVLAVDLENEAGRQRIVNVYVPTRFSPVGESQQRVLDRVKSAVGQGESLVTGDFNLHHSLWGGDRVRHADDLAGNLIQLMEDKKLSLTTPTGTITWRNAGSPGTTIDLTFATEGLQGRVLRCRPLEDPGTIEDHTAIETIVGGAPMWKDRYRWSWKDTDPEAVLKDSQKLWVPVNFLSTKHLDDYAEYVQNTTADLAGKHGKRIKVGRGGRSWWSKEVQDAVHDYKEALRRRDRPDRVLEARRRRNKSVKRSQTNSFREAVHKASGDPQGLWKLARWGREGSHQPPQPPRVPVLNLQDGCKAETFEEKARALRDQFFPLPELADLSDIPNNPADYAADELPPPVITEEDIAATVATLPNDKAPGASGVPNRFLKLMGQPLVAALRAIAQGCLDWEHYPRIFKKARTVVLKKPGKPDYQQPKAWRPIALLEVLGKVIEATIGNRLRALAENHGLLPDRQMGARKGRSTDTALALLLGLIRAAWEEPGAVATVLSLDISGAFDRVIRERLIHVLRSRKVPRGICGWVNSFMLERRTTLAFDDQETDDFLLPGGVPQGSPISPILFLFYNAELIEECGKHDSRLDRIGFVDDMNMVAFGRSTEDNCRRLERAHDRCMDWARRYGAKFAPEKYELMHFSRRRCYDMEAAITVNGQTKTPAQVMRILGVWLDPGLRWGGHLEETARKLRSQTRALTCLSASTWGLPLIQARLVYKMVVLPALAHGALAWHQPGRSAGASTPRGLATKLKPRQNDCLRSITGAYKATPISTMEAETNVCPLDLYLDNKVAKAVHRLKQTGVAAQIEQACSGVRHILKGRHRKKPHLLSEVVHPAQVPGDWMETSEKEVDEKTQRLWSDQWRERQKPWGEIHSRPPDRRNLEIYRGLTKARCSILIQLRSGKTGLAGFLHRRRVPGYNSPLCECGQGTETPTHVLVHCPKHANARCELLRNGRVDVKTLLNTPKGAAQLSGWWLRHGILGQFALAGELETSASIGTS